ncbi:MAG: cytosol aminopeptidase, partial [Chlorobiales bacterium]|nr:cytosol aminopeptidase [Chlorobiales bacterium]
MKISVSKSPIASLRLDAIVVPIEKQGCEKALEAIYKITGVAEKSIDDDFKAEVGDATVIYPQDKAFASKRVICLGLGDKVNNDSIRKAAATLGAKAKAMKIGTLGIDLSEIAAFAKQASEPEGYIAQVFIESFEHGAYEFTQLKTDRIEVLKNGKKSDGKKTHEIKELQLI